MLMRRTAHPVRRMSYHLPLKISFL